MTTVTNLSNTINLNVSRISAKAFIVGGWATQSSDYSGFNSVFENVAVFTYDSRAELYKVQQSLIAEIIKYSPDYLIGHSMGALILLNAMQSRKIPTDMKIILFAPYIANGQILSTLTNLIPHKWLSPATYFSLPALFLAPPSSTTDNTTLIEDAVALKNWSLQSLQQIHDAIKLFPSVNALVHIVKNFTKLVVIECMNDELVAAKISSLIDIYKNEVEDKFVFANYEHSPHNDNNNKFEFFTLLHQIADGLNPVVAPSNDPRI